MASGGISEIREVSLLALVIESDGTQLQQLSISQLT